MNPDEDDYLTTGVMFGRCVAWIIDVCLIGLLLGGLWWVFALFGILTLGWGFGLLSILPFVPFCYHMFSLLGTASATPGQQAMGLTVRRDDDLGPPSPIQAAVSTLLFYVTVATSGLLLAVALFTTRHRTLHDILSGLVVVRRHALDTLTPRPGPWNMYNRSSAGGP